MNSLGEFHPKTAGLSNNHSIQYYYLDSSTGCDNSITETFRVDSVTHVTLGLIPDYCLNYPLDTLSQGSFHTPGFKYEGYGIKDSSVFDPRAAGVGSGTVEYIFTNSFGCRDTASQVVTVHDLPIVKVNIPPAYQSWCQNDGLIPLSFATPAGGVYAADSGITGNSFDPTSARLGNNDLIYTYTDTNNCQHADTGIIEIKTIPVVSVLPDTFCLNEGYLTLTSGNPSGGFYQGPGMVSNTIFNPTIAGVGNKTIQYTYQAPNGCSESAVTSYRVNSLPIVSFASPAPICLNAGARVLTGATTNGDSSYFVGTGILNNSSTFDPVVAGIGPHSIRFIGIDTVSGCRDTMAQLIQVDTVPVVTLSQIPDTCANAFSFQLTQGSPKSGGSGIYSGPGVSGSFFNPQLVTPGQPDTIIYSFTDFNGCKAQDSTIIHVDTLPVVLLKSLPLQCIGNDTLALDTFGAPLGGVFSGNNVDQATSRFAPSAVGSSIITYTFVDSKGCSGSQSQFITVNALPAVSLSFDTSFCENAGPQPLQGGFPPGGNYRASTGIFSGMFVPDSVHSLKDTLYYTYTDAFGCKDSVWEAISIDTLQKIVTTPVPDLCKGDPSIDLEPYASPKGGTFSGVSIFGTSFVPNLLDTGTYFYQYTFTDSNNCIVQSLDTIFIRPVPDLRTTPDPSICVGESVQLNASGGLSYSWNTGQFGSSIQVTPGTSTTYDVETVNGYNCKSSASIQVTVFDRYQVFTTGLPADCGQANGSGVISASGGASPYSYFWSDGDRNSINRNLFAGTYQVTVVDKNQCTEYATVNISNRNGPSVSLDSIQNNTCYGDEMGWLKVSATGGTGDLSYNWSNGFKTDSLIGLPAGKYDLTVSDEKGCIAVRTYEITEGSPISIESILTEPLCDSASGSIIVSPEKVGAVYTYNWLHGPVGDTLKNLDPGTYSLALSDTNQCKDTVDFNLSTTTQPEVRVDSLFHTWCGTDTGAIFTTPLDTAYRYDWSSGDTTVSIHQLATGNYTVTISDTTGCTRITTFEIEQEAPSAVSICLVTNDTLIGQNVVIWDTTGRSGDQLYRIYRESGIQGKYFELGTVLAGQKPMFRDSTLLNQTLKGNYRVTAEDACSEESSGEQVHGSILLSGERISGNGVQLSWSNYTGIQVPKYFLYRYTTSRGLELLDSIGTTFPTYTDYGAPAKEDETYHYYFVSADPLSQCDTSFPMILSNYSFNFGKGPTTGLTEYSAQWGMKVWPNPNQGEFTLRFSGSNREPMTIRLFDQHGKIHHQQQMDGFAHPRDISIKLYDISAGVYYLQVVSNGNVKTERVSINP
ncbi:T9SS type A sorting domain-containing protein [bacterium SCSIO 12741]|nr:T9SS type A sorting domain-containing protein [bacterium SCSIO 12741]